MRTTVVVTTTFRSERRKRRSTVALLFGALLLAAPAGCSSCGEQPASAGDAGVAELGPVPAPQGLAAELFVGKPGDTWARLRNVGGGAARLLPQSFGLLLTTLLGLPPAVADVIDADLPLTGALANAKEGEPAFVFAVHVKSGRELVARLSGGGDAAYSAREDAAAGLTLLEPKPGKASSDVALAVVGNYLLASRHSADLARLGPYAARTLPKQTPPKEPVSLALRKAALAETGARLLRDTWKERKTELERVDRANRQRHGGRAPDFGDPMAALGGIDSAVEDLAKVLESAAGGRLTIEPFEQRVEVALEVNADEKGAAAELVSSMVVGDAAPLLRLPGSTPIALLTRSTRATRESRAKSMEEGISELFGERLLKADRDKVSTALGQLAAGRGDSETYAVIIGEGRGGIVYRSPVTDPKAFDAGAKGLFRLLEIKAFSEPVRQFVGETTLKQSTAELPGIPGTVQRSLLTVKPSGMRTANDKSGKVGAEPQHVEAIWFVKEGQAYGALSMDTVPVLGTLVGAESDPKSTHANEPRVRQALERVKEASFVVLLQPLKLPLGQNAVVDQTSPVVLSFGRSGRSATLRLDADQVALEAVLKLVVLGRK